MNLKNNIRIFQIDSLRGIAVLAVFLFHLNNGYLPGGFVGVDIFFVVSGFVISRSIMEHSRESLKLFLKNFYYRRLVRIFPAFSIFLLIFIIVDKLFIPESWLSQNNKNTALSSLVSLSNYYLLDTADGYFSERINFNPFLHLWSLSLETQFYLITPIFIYLLWHPKKMNQIFAKTVLIITTIASFVVSIMTTETSAIFAYYSIFSRFWEFSIGIFALYLCENRNKNKNFTNPLLGYIGLSLIIYSFIKIDIFQFPFYWALVPTIGTFFLLLSIKNSSVVTHEKSGSFFHRFLNSSILQFFGRISFSLYLYHWGVIVLFRWTIGDQTIFLKSLIVIISILMSVVSYKYVETTIGKDLKEVITNQQPSKFLIVPIILLAISVALLLPKSIFSLSKSDKTATWDSVQQTSFSKKYLMGDKSQLAGKKLLIIGDSHAGAYSLLSDLIRADLKIETEIYSVPGCPLFAFLGNYSDSDTMCVNFQKNALQESLRRTKEGDVVFFASLRTPRLSNQWGPVDIETIKSNLNSENAKLSRDDEFAKSLKIIDELMINDRKVLIDFPKPVFKAPIYRCLDWFNRNNWACSEGFDANRSELESINLETRMYLSKLQIEKHIFLWDPFYVLCPEQVCQAKIGETNLYFDGDHLSFAGNRMLLESFERLLISIWDSKV